MPLLVGPDGKIRIKNGKILLGADGDPCCCGDVEYIQAKACFTGADVDLWFAYNPAGATINTTYSTTTATPFFFHIGSNHYYVNITSNISATHGTMASGYTSESGTASSPTGCPVTCARCTGAFTGVSVTFDSVQLLDTLLCYAYYRTYNYLRTINGTFDLDPVGGPATCHWYKEFPAPHRFRQYNGTSDNPCPEPPTIDVQTMSIDFQWLTTGAVSYMKVLCGLVAPGNVNPNEYFNGTAATSPGPCIGNDITISNIHTGTPSPTAGGGSIGTEGTARVVIS